MHLTCALNGDPSMIVLLDSVEQGDKIVQTALDNFGRVGRSKCFIIQCNDYIPN